LDSGKSAQFFQDAVVEAGAVLVLAEGIALEVDVGGDDVAGGEAAVGGGEVDEAFGEKAGEEQEGSAGEDLGSYEASAQQAASAGA
jgi:hypothetical protein